MFRSDPAMTAQRIRDLQRYLHREVMRACCEDAADFVCPSRGACEASAVRPGVAFAAGQMSHVGEHYDLSEDGHALRIVVVGQEVGTADAYVDLATRRQQVLTGSGRRHSNSPVDGPVRNPHMRGTTAALRALVGRDGTERESEFLDLASGERVHVFDAFALVNVLLCSAYATGKSKQGRSTAAMRKNCLRHFSETLRLLDPNVIIVQGLDTWRWIAGLFETDGEDLVPGAGRFRLGGRQLHIARFTHPSVPDRRQWGRGDAPPYLLETVMPALRRVRSELRDERNRLLAMLRFVGMFDAPEAAGAWAGGETIAPNTISMPFFALSDAASAFIEACYDYGWVLTDDWLPWASNAELCAEDTARFKALGTDDLARCLTVYIRADRFSEGTLAHCLQNGAIAAILRRMATIAAELR